MKTVISLKNQHPFALPEEFEDIRFTEEFVEIFLEEFTKEGDVVLDPFAGYGTTLRVAERMCRQSYGIDYDEEKIRYAKGTLQNPETMLFGDALKLDEYDIPNFDFSLTSPLYMQKGDKNPFHTTCTAPTEYDQYLSDLVSVYEQIAKKLNPGGVAVIEVSNVKRDGNVTTLAWDIVQQVSKIMEFQGEIVLHWEGGYGYEYDHSYALVFKRKDE